MKRGKSYVHNKHTQISPKELQREIYIYIYIYIKLYKKGSP